MLILPGLVVLRSDTTMFSTSLSLSVLVQQLKTLMAYVHTFGLNVRPDCSRDECATAVAK
jgi:hypothetical protein